MLPKSSKTLEGRLLIFGIFRSVTEVLGGQRALLRLYSQSVI